jgi:hypothetical protein
MFNAMSVSFDVSESGELAQPLLAASHQAI